jgi:hypothetical protein
MSCFPSCQNILLNLQKKNEVMMGIYQGQAFLLAVTMHYESSALFSSLLQQCFVTCGNENINSTV